MEGSILRETSVNLILIGQRHWGQLLSFHQEVKRFRKEWTCWHSTNRRSTVCFDSHTWQESLSNFGLEKFVASVQDVMVYFKLKHRKLYLFFVSLNGRTYNAAIVWSVKPASTIRTSDTPLFFFYKNIFYKNIEAEICEILRIL